MAAAGFKPPSFDWDSDNLPDELARFKQYCELVFQGPFHKKLDKEKASYILLWIGKTGVDLFNSWSWENEEDKYKPDIIWEKLKTHLEPKVNYRLARYQLQQFRQKAEESADDYIARCRNQARKCKFRDERELAERLTEQLIIGTKHCKVQEKLLEKGDELTLDTAIDIARTFEATIHQLSQLNPNNDNPVHAIHNSSKRECRRCGKQHGSNATCPAMGSTCKACGKANHWARVCRSKSKGGPTQGANQQPQHKTTFQRKKGKNQKAHAVAYGSEEESTEEFDSLTFESVTVDTVGQTRDEVFVNIKVELPSKPRCTTRLKAKVDTGAQANILPLRIYRSMFPENIREDNTPITGALDPTSVTLTAYGGSKLRQYGTCMIPCEYNKVKNTTTFYVTDANGPAIIGLPTSTKMKLITLNCAVEAKTPIQGKEDLIRQYPACFDGIGKLQGAYHISVDPTVPPVVHPPRRVPISLKDDIQKELNEMTENGIIKKIEDGEPTAWVNSLVYRRKPNGELRICLDPKDLNRAILREHHVTPTLQEILPKLNGATVFSIVDAKCGYWNVQLDEQSSYLTTFNSPFGRYRFLRMPFGLKMSQDVFQRKIDQTYEGCEGVIGIADDIVVYGKGDEEHDANMHQMMARTQQTGLKLNPMKCRIKENRIKFFGVICSSDGIQADPDKVSALKQMAPPKNTQELQTFLGLATYMSPFIPNLSTLTAPLREMLKKENQFDWHPTHQEVFEKITASISEELTLAYFDPSKEITLQVDASLKGLGAALTQEGKPVAFASKALTEVESRYANIERELLAVVYACERFHTYLYGHQFTVESDHKPLESIHLKHLTSAPPRLQRMLLRLQPYDLKIKYRPGKKMKLADALSRLSPEDTSPVKNMDVQIHQICPQFDTNLLQQIREETRNDPELEALKEIIYIGWPQKQDQLPTPLKPYWSFRDELAVEDSIILKGSRIVIPGTLQSRILSKLHTAHQGIEKTKLRARTSVFWRSLNKDIEQMIKSCPTCQKHQSKQNKEPLIQTEVPPRPWHTIGTDLFDLDEEEYLLVADYYSKYPFVRRIPPGRSTSLTVSKLTKQIFSEQGIPTLSDQTMVPSTQAKLFNSSPRSTVSNTLPPHHTTQKATVS